MKAGPLVSVRIAKNQGGYGYGFIEYQHECSVEYAIQLFHRTTLFGQELQLKVRKRNNADNSMGQNTTRRERESNNQGRPNQKNPENEMGYVNSMPWNNSLPAGLNMPFASPLLFCRPPYMPNFPGPLSMPPMFNPMLGLPIITSPMIVPQQSQHVRFDDNGMPRSDSIPIPQFPNERQGSSNFVNHKRYDNQINDRRDNRSEEKRYSNSDQRDRHQGRRPDRSESYDSRYDNNRDGYRNERTHYENDRRSSRTEHPSGMSGRYRSDDYQDNRYSNRADRKSDYPDTRRRNGEDHRNNFHEDTYRGRSSHRDRPVGRHHRFDN